jgi:FKBP-type peptidyl-prolyl cis-trans isomerase
MLSKSPLLLFAIFGIAIQPSIALSSSSSNHHDGKNRMVRRQVIQTIVGAAAVSLPAYAESDVSSFQEGPGGIKYSVLKEGSGEKPVRAQQVYAKYTLWTGGFGEDGGKQVDSNTGFFGNPLGVIVGVGKVIKGWDLELLDMRVGETRRMAIPSDLGYGDKGAGGSIPPKATLYFEVEISSMDPMIQLNEQQKKWLEERPL